MERNANSWPRYPLASKKYEEDYGPARCQYCQARFMGEDKAEVVDKATGKILIIHADCFSSERMDVA